MHWESPVRLCLRKFSFLRSGQDFGHPVYFGLYKFALRMGTDLVLKALAFNAYMAVDWRKIATNNDFLRYDFGKGEVLAVEK